MQTAARHRPLCGAGRASPCAPSCWSCVIFLWRSVRRLRRAQLVVLGHHERARHRRARGEPRLAGAQPARGGRDPHRRSSTSTERSSTRRSPTAPSCATTPSATPAASRAPRSPCSTTTAPASCSAPSRRATSRAST